MSNGRERTSPQITTLALILTWHTMMTLLYIAVFAGFAVFNDGEAGGSMAVWLWRGLFGIIAATAFVAAMGLFTAPRLCSVLALVAASLFLWLGLYLIYASEGRFTLASPIAFYYVLPALLVLLPLLPVLKTWAKQS